MSGHTPWREIKHKAKAGRPPTDDDATQNLASEDDTQTLPKGTKIGLRPKRDVMADFRRIVRGRDR
jgi:hypothetical protein